jgi:hypothetical protein
MLPDTVLHFFVGLFLVSLVIFVVVPAVFGYWRLAHNGQARQARVMLEDVPAIVIALLLINLFCYVLGIEGTRPMPHGTLRLLLAALDLPFILFLLDTLIVFLISRRESAAVVSDAPKENPPSSVEA